jgi:hypothetical protein
MQLAADEYRLDTWTCHVSSDEIRWPCVRVVGYSVDFEGSDLESTDEPLVCYNLRIDLETTKWSPERGTHEEPRTFTPSREPLNICHKVTSFFGGDWYLQASEDEEWRRLLPDALWQQHCQAGPCEN